MRSYAKRISECISIHAAREGGDVVTQIKATSNKIFQSTPPVKAATVNEPTIFNAHVISIHAAREGGDSRQTQIPCYCHYFNPRRP